VWRRFPWYVASCEVFYIRGSCCPHPRHVLLHWDIMKPGSELQSPSSARRSHSLVLCAFSHLHHTHTTNTNTTTTSLEAISKEVQQLSAGEMGSLIFVRRQVSSKGCVSKIIDWALLRHSTDRIMAVLRQTTSSYALLLTVLLPAHREYQIWYLTVRLWANEERARGTVRLNWSGRYA